MAKKVTSSETNPPVQIPPAPRKQRVKVPIQSDLAIAIEQHQKSISSLKALNKLTPVINAMDKDGIVALHKIVQNRFESLNNP